jgi:hypothetical protein
MTDSIPTKCAHDQSGLSWRHLCAPCKKAALGTELGKPSRLFPGKDLRTSSSASLVDHIFAEKGLLPVGEFQNIWKWHDRLNQIDAWRAPLTTDAQPSGAWGYLSRRRA